MRLTCPDDLAQRPQAEREKFIDNWLKDVVPTVVELCGEGRQFYGMDFARSVDLSSIWIQEREGSKARVIAVLELGKTPHASQEQILFRVMDAIPRFAGGAHDARGNGSALAEVAAQRYGWGRITQVKATSNWYLEHFPRLKAALEDGSLYDVPRDDEIINDFRTVRVVAGIPRVTEKRTRGKGGQKRHGDTAIAACLAWSAMGSDIGPIEYRSAGNRGRPQQWDAEGPELDYEAGILRSELNLEGW